MFNYRPVPPPNPRPSHPVPTLAPALWAGRTLQFQPDPHQASVLDCAHRRVLVNCCRQWGKSTTAAVRALYHAIHNSESETILIAPTQRQSSELLRKIRSFASLLPDISLRSDGSNRQSLQFSNRSRIIALPGKRDNIRGFSRVSLLIIDEAGWVPDDLYYAVRPFLAAAPQASLLIMSTPNGDAGFFFDAWSGPGPWLRITVPATECPRISPDFLAEERRTLSDHFYRQEYLCEFRSHRSAVISSEQIDAFFSNTPFGSLQPVEFPR